MSYWSQFSKPQGFLGKIILKRMNVWHASKTKWAMSFVNMYNKRTLLDVGCGGGAFIKHMLKTYPDLCAYGLDYSNVSVQTARKVNQRFLPSRCEIDEGSVACIPYRDCSFDLITAFASIYYWPDIRENFKEIYRVLNNSGTAVIDCTLCEFADTGSGNACEQKVPMTKLYKSEIIVQFLEEVGFVNIQICKAVHPLRKYIIAYKQ